MQFRGGMNELMRQAARMQRRIEIAKKELSDKEISATSVGDKIKVTVTYARKVQRIEIEPEFLASEGIDMALDGDNFVGKSPFDSHLGSSMISSRCVPGELARIHIQGHR